MRICAVGTRMAGIMPIFLMRAQTSFRFSFHLSRYLSHRLFGVGSGQPIAAARDPDVESGNRKILRTRPEISPPTMTIAKGRCESEPMPCDRAAGSSPRVATSMVIMMGRSLERRLPPRHLRMV